MYGQSAHHLAANAAACRLPLNRLHGAASTRTKGLQPIQTTLNIYLIRISRLRYGCRGGFFAQ